MSDDHDCESFLTPDQRHTALNAPLFVLRFLVDPSQRQEYRNGIKMTSFSDSAVFHRLRDLLWCLNEPQVIDLLTADEKDAVTEFNEAFLKLPWRAVESHPHISELPDDDLWPLMPAGVRLYRLLEARNLI